MNEILDLYDDNNNFKNFECIKVQEKYFDNSRNSKVDDKYIEQIKEICEKHLNCYKYRNPILWCKKLCSDFNIDFNLVKNYDPNNFSYTDYYDKAKTMRQIRQIRKRKCIDKNFTEVYENFIHTDFYNSTDNNKKIRNKKNNISYSCFYLYARE